MKKMVNYLMLVSFASVFYCNIALCKDIQGHNVEEFQVSANNWTYRIDGYQLKENYYAFGGKTVFFSPDGSLVAVEVLFRFPLHIFGQEFLINKNLFDMYAIYQKQPSSNEWVLKVRPEQFIEKAFRKRLSRRNAAKTINSASQNALNLTAQQLNNVLNITKVGPICFNPSNDYLFVYEKDLIFDVKAHADNLITLALGAKSVMYGDYTSQNLRIRDLVVKDDVLVIETGSVELNLVGLLSRLNFECSGNSIPDATNEI